MAAIADDVFGAAACFSFFFGTKSEADDDSSSSMTTSSFPVSYFAMLSGIQISCD